MVNVIKLNSTINNKKTTIVGGFFVLKKTLYLYK